MSKALETIGQALSIKSRLLSLRKQEEELQKKDTPLEKNDAYNDLVGSYLKTYDNSKKVIEEFGNDPKFIQAKNNAELQLRGAMAVPLNIAAAGQQAHKTGAGSVAAASVETANMVLDAEGLADQDVQDRLGRLLVKNGAAAQGVRIPEMSVERQSRNIVKDFYDVKDEDLDEIQVSDSQELQGKLQRVRVEATRLFNESGTNSNMSPEERLTFSLTAALNNEDIVGEGTDSATAPEALYITQQVMEGLTRRQGARLEGALAQLPALNRKYEESAGAVLYDFMEQSKADGKEISYSNLLSSVGENELYRALRSPEGLGVAYQSVKDNIAEINQNYDKLPPDQRFALFVNAFTDFASRNVDTGSPIRDQYQLTGLERIRSSVDQGTLRAKFAGLVAPLEELYRDFDSQHNEITAERNGIISQKQQAGNIAITAPDGRIMSWQASRRSIDNERMKKVLSSPAVFDLMQDMNKVTTDTDGNYVLNVGDVDPLALNTYGEAMSLGGEWTRMTLQPATPNTEAVTMDNFSPEGKVVWGNSLASFTEEILGDYDLFKDKDTNAITELATYHANGIPFGKIISRSPELTAAFFNADGNPNQIQAVANAALSMHYQAIDNTVIQQAVRADSEVTTKLLSAMPAEVRESVRADMLRGNFTTISDQIPIMSAEVEAQEEQLLTLLEDLGVDIGFARTDDPERSRLVSPARGGIERFFQTFGIETVQHNPEVARQLTNLRKTKQKASAAAGVLGNYLKLIDKQGEVEVLSDTLGLAPPRAWAFIQNTDSMITELKEISK